MCTIGHMKTKQTELDTLFAEAVKYLADYFENSHSLCHQSKEWIEDLAFVEYLLDGVEIEVSVKIGGKLHVGETIQLERDVHNISGDRIGKGVYRIVNTDGSDGTVLLSGYGWVKQRKIRGNRCEVDDLGYGKSKNRIQGLGQAANLRSEALQIARGVW